MKKDFATMLYTIAEEEGECSDNIQARLDRETGKVQWFVRAHKDSDGVDALMERLRNDKIQLPSKEMFKIKSYKPPSLLARFWLLLVYLKSISAIKYPWKKKFEIDRNRRGYGACIAYALFTKEETKKILDFCHSLKISATALLYQTLDKTTVEFLFDEPCKRAWCMPVNMRGGVEADNDLNNLTSSITIRFPKEGLTIEETNKKIKSLYKSGYHWGVWTFGTLWKYISLKRIKQWNKKARDYLVKRNSFSYLGLYSNMGNFGPPVGDGFASERYHYFGAPPVTTVCPVSSGSFSWRGSLSISLQIHPGITDTINDNVDMLKFWVTKIRETISKDSKLIIDENIIHYITREEFETNVKRF